MIKPKMRRFSGTIFPVPKRESHLISGGQLVGSLLSQQIVTALLVEITKNRVLASPKKSLIIAFVGENKRLLWFFTSPKRLDWLRRDPRHSAHA